MAVTAKKKTAATTERTTIKVVREVISAADWAKRLSALDKMAEKERTEYLRKRAFEISVEDLRDETMAVIRNSPLRYEDVHARFGSHPSTLKKWDEKTVMRPQMAKIRSALRACGFDLGVVALGGEGDA